MLRNKENLSTCYKCQAQLPNYWIADLKSFDNNQNVKPICKTVRVARSTPILGLDYEVLPVHFCTQELYEKPYNFVYYLKMTFLGQSQCIFYESVMHIK